MNATRALLATARAQALYTSDISADRTPTRDEVSTAVRYAIRLHGGVRGCAGEVAAAYGDHPETAVPRMRWALRAVAAAYLVDTQRPALLLPAPVSPPRRSVDAHA
jgi:hypothetical protein